jgi:hypothetical protein
MSVTREEYEPTRPASVRVARDDADVEGVDSRTSATIAARIESLPPDSVEPQTVRRRRGRASRGRTGIAFQ